MRIYQIHTFDLRTVRMNLGSWLLQVRSNLKDPKKKVFPLIPFPKLSYSADLPGGSYYRYIHIYLSEATQHQLTRGACSWKTSTWTLFSYSSRRHNVTLSFLHQPVHCVTGGLNSIWVADDDRMKKSESGGPPVSEQICMLCLSEGSEGLWWVVRAACLPRGLGVTGEQVPLSLFS